MSKTNIIQTYLYSKDVNVERRVRQRGTKQDRFTFYYTEKTNIGLGERLEKEEKISPNEYISYLSEADTNLHQISKVRYCFIFDKRYYEMDLYSFSDNYAIVEIELNNITEEINLPPLSFVKEVTDDDRYRNHSLAKTLSFDTEKDMIDYNWTYETGIEIPEILGSGSSFSNVFKTKDEEKAFEESHQKGRNYLVRYKKKGRYTENHQFFDVCSGAWIDD